MLELLPNIPGNIVFRSIEDSLTVEQQGYWGNHYDFGVPMVKGSTLLGHAKVREIVINTLLPFAYAWSELHNERKRKAAIKKVFLAYPGAGDNQLTCYMKQRLFHRTDVRHTGAQQQGLLHIFHRYCRYKHCSECPVLAQNLQ
jgi:hypothetical protein